METQTIVPICMDRLCLDRVHHVLLATVRILAVSLDEMKNYWRTRVLETYNLKKAREGTRRPGRGYCLQPRVNGDLEEAQAGIKIARRNINNLRYADDTTIMAESEELKHLLMKVKEESEKVDLKLNIQKTKIMASSPITSWQIDGEPVETVADFYFGVLQNHCRWWLQPWN